MTDTMAVFEMSVYRDGVLIDVLDARADGPQSAEEDIRATARDEYGADVEVGGLRRKGATGV